MFGPLGFSLAPYVNSSRRLSRWITPIANWYANASGYRKYGFKYDDLCMQSQLVRNRIFRSPPLFAFSGWRNSRRSASMPNILYIFAHKTFHLSYTKIGFEPIDPQRTIRPRVPSEAGFASQCPTCPDSKRTMDPALRGVHSHSTAYYALWAHVI